MEFKAWDWVSYCGMPYRIVWIKHGKARICNNEGMEKVVDVSILKPTPDDFTDCYPEE